MNKIKFAIASILAVIFTIAIGAFAAEVKNASAPAPAASTATPKRIQQPSAPPVAPGTPAAASTQIQQPPPAPASTDNYSYNPSGKPDPFRPFVVIVDVTAKQQVVKKAEASMFPLQRAETEKYRVVGIAGDKDHRVAIAEDAAKKFYPLFIGTHIGLYNGKVIEIMSDRVIVEEYEANKAKRVILKLRKN
jgi:type IV pilus assembly protein PilP